MTQLQNALKRPYNRVLFAREVLAPIFGSNFTLNSPLKPAPMPPNKSESASIDTVGIYGNIRLNDGTEITCYEVLLQPKSALNKTRLLSTIC